MKHIPLNKTIETFIKSLGASSTTIHSVEWRVREGMGDGNKPDGLIITLSTGDIISIRGGSSSGLGFTQIEIHSAEGVCIAYDGIEE